MNRLFNTRKVVWVNNQYNEIADDIEDDAGTAQNNIILNNKDKTHMNDDDYDPYDEEENIITTNKIQELDIVEYE